MSAENELLPQGQPSLDNLDAPGDEKVYTMYHGTSKQAAAIIWNTGFKQSSDGMLGRGVYLSRDLQKASRYPLGLPESQRVVLKVRVNVGKVIAINHQGHPLKKSWHDLEYDTAWCPPKCDMTPSGLEEDCVWDPNRIIVIDTFYPGQHQPDTSHAQNNLQWRNGGVSGLEEVLRSWRRADTELNMALLKLYRALIKCSRVGGEFRRTHIEWSRTVDNVRKAEHCMYKAILDSKEDLGEYIRAASELSRAKSEHNRAARDHEEAQGVLERAVREFNAAAGEYDREVNTNRR